ncbi:MAG: sigma-54-dependent Fis family transcriptional regulator [Elusimicrobia bacterium]|nr:sigma-54-dependent Fis family transcriptional regulator [Elusimicrobiota bacterium]
MNSKNSALLVEDDDSMRTVLSLDLKRLGLEVTAVSGGREAISAMRARGFDLVVTDLLMEKVDGFQVLENARRQLPEAQVIVITGHGSIDSAVRAMKSGAFDYITKPVEPEVLGIAVGKAMERKRLLGEIEHLRAQVRGKFSFESIIYASPAFDRVLELVRKVAATHASVLIEGESGVGKELIARAIHTSSPRRNHPFVAINCGALPEGLLESELFGHARGSFTGAVANKRGLFEEAHDGTLFLDEIGEMAPALQVKLLRALQQGEVRRVGENRNIKVNARIIAASNRDLKAAVDKGSFRDDLYYRLKVFPIVIPPLRDRREDILPLAENFLKRAREKHSGKALRFSPPAAQALIRYRWAGNVRELEHAVERAVILCSGDVVQLEDLPPEVQADDLRPAPAHTLEAIEKQHILRVLDACGGAASKAAKSLGISRDVLLKKLNKFRAKTPVQDR